MTRKRRLANAVMVTAGLFSAALLSHADTFVIVAVICVGALLSAWALIGKARNGEAEGSLPQHSAFDAGASFAPSIPLAGTFKDMPLPGERAGAVLVTESTPYLLILRGRLLPAMVQAIGGGLALAAIIALGVFVVLQALKGKESHVEGLILLSLCALGALTALLLALPRIGLTYRVDGRAHTLSRQRLIGSERVWHAHEVNHVLLQVTPPEADGYFGRGRLLVAIVGPDGKWLCGDALFGHPWTRTRLALGSARAAMAAARLLNVPVRLEGSTERCADELKALLSGAAVGQA